MRTTRQQREFFRQLNAALMMAKEARAAIAKAMRIAPSLDDAETAARLMPDASKLERDLADEVDAIAGWEP